MKMLRCPICGTVKATARRNQTCSYECGQALMERKRPGFHRQNGLKASAITAQKTRQKTEARWQAKYPGVPVETARAIYLQGYLAGHRAGTANGYEAALKDMPKAGAA